MISFFSNWIEQISVSVIIVSIFEMIIPRGNIKKYINIVLGIYITYCLIAPFVNSQSLFDLDEKKLTKIIENEEKQTNVNQETMDKRLEKLYIDEIEKNIKSKLEELGYETSKCKIDANLQTDSENPGIHKVKLTIKRAKNINIEKVEIGEQSDSNNDKEEKDRIKTEIANFLEIDENNIDIKIST